MTPAYEAGLRLLEIDHYERAATEFRRHLTECPLDAPGHAFLAYGLVCLRRITEAKREARLAIELDPTCAFAYFALGVVLLKQRRADEAREAFREAIRLAPENATFHGHLGASELLDQRWSRALEAAEQGLAKDPENPVCLNLKATSLTFLGRRDEARQILLGALASDPESAWTRSNQGLVELNAGRSNDALDHYREALRIDPMSVMALSGMREALKSRNLVYRAIFTLSFRITRLPPVWRWGLVVVVLFSPIVLSGAGAAAPRIAWITRMGTRAILALVVVMSIASPLFDLRLRFDPLGRRLLSPNQIRGANLLAVFLFPALGLWVASWFAREPHLDWFHCTAIAFGAFVLPASALHSCARGWPRATMLASMVFLLPLSLMVLIGVASEARSYSRDGMKAVMRSPGEWLPGFPLLVHSPWASFVLAQWLTNAKVRR